MGVIDYLILAIIVVIVGGAVAYIVKAKKSGQKCIGCPDSKSCSGRCEGCSCRCSGAESK